jgi:hypothetical protein
LTAAVTLVLAMMVLPVFASNVSTLFAGADAFDQAIQAQQYALIRADIIRKQKYEDVATQARTGILNSGGFEEEVVVGAEVPISESGMQKIANVNIYKKDEAQARYVLKVPVSTLSGSVVSSQVSSGIDNLVYTAVLDANVISVLAITRYAPIDGGHADTNNITVKINGLLIDTLISTNTVYKTGDRGHYWGYQTEDTQVGAWAVAIKKGDVITVDSQSPAGRLMKTVIQIILGA